MADQIEVLLNGAQTTTRDGTTVAAFLDALGLPHKGIAVERNREIVPRSAYDATALTAGDRIEIVQFVGGG